MCRQQKFSLLVSTLIAFGLGACDLAQQPAQQAAPGGFQTQLPPCNQTVALVPDEDYDIDPETGQEEPFIRHDVVDAVSQASGVVPAPAPTPPPSQTPGTQQPGAPQPGIGQLPDGRPCRL
jgi:hypothetical protein